MPVYLSIFALAQYVAPLCHPDLSSHIYSVFQFVMALDAVWARNVLQFISLAYVLNTSAS